MCKLIKWIKNNKLLSAVLKIIIILVIVIIILLFIYL